ncbi:hypothetical protein AB0D98_11010 [Streptomyces sp. NPDC047987]|uniref:hypothetical protein n=1 Tax=unclassified Streptomyces TaxID=2593676 RepID=UPI003423ED90
MAVNLVKPDPDDEDLDLADVVELASAQGISTALRLREWCTTAWARFLQEGDRTSNGERAMSAPSLRPYLVNRGDLHAARIGALIIFRSSWALARRAVTMAVALVRKSRGTGTTEGKEGEEKAAESGKKTAKGKKSEKKNSTVSIDTVIGALIITGMVGTFVVKTLIPFAGGAVTGLLAWAADHPVSALRAAGFVLVIFVPVAWIVGRIAPDGEGGRTAAAHAPLESGTEAADRGERLLWHVLRCLADAESAGRRAVHLDVVRDSAAAAHLIPEGTKVTVLRAWVESTGLPVDDKVGMRIKGKSVTRVGLRVDTVGEALGMTPTEWVRARAATPAEGGPGTPAQPVGEAPEPPPAEALSPAPAEGPAPAALRIIPGGADTPF